MDIALVKKAKHLWDTWDIRVFILASLFIQVFLTILAPLRKSSSSSCLRFFIWLFYLTADAVGIFVIGLISSNETQDPHKLEILAFWAPFLLLHLGGPDTITALALEDNELWNRHALQLGTQLIITVYVFIITFQGKQNFHLFLPTIFMVMDGVIKYLERTCALFFASADSFRDSLVSTAEPGPNYARLMEEYFSAKEAHIPTNFEGTSGRAAGDRRAEDREDGSNYDTQTDDLYHRLNNDEMEVVRAHHYYELFKAILADGFLSLKDRKKSRDFFINGDQMSKFNIIQIELNLIYDTFYTKLYLLQRKRAFFRVFCFSFVIGSLVYFSHTVVKDPKRYDKVDTKITFVLLGVAMLLDFCSVIMFVMSDWWIVAIPFDGRFKSYFKELMLRILGWSRWARRLFNRPRWSKSISGYNLLRCCFRDPPSFFAISLFSSVKRVRDLLTGFLYVKDQCAGDKLLEYVVEKINEKAKLAQEIEEAKEVCSARGNLVFENDYYLVSECLSPWTVDIDYDESLLIWHLATDFCYWTNSDKETGDHREHSKVLSDYMSYILLRQQTMVSLVVGMADTRFVDTCADAKKFISDESLRINWCRDWWGQIKTSCSCCCPRGTRRAGEETTPEDIENEFFKKFSKKVLEVKADVQPIVAKGDKSKSVLFDACRLAKQLEMFGQKKWEIISKVWVEMLCYAAVRCSPRSHIARLNKGGELITLVWLYMAHLGLGERFLQNQGFGWTKLLIKK